MDIKNLSLQNFQDWPVQFKAAVFGGIVVATFFLGYKFNLTDQKKELAQVFAQEADYKSQIEFVIAKNKSLSEEVSKLPEVKNLLADWEKQLVSYNDLPQLLNEILKLGGNNNLYFSTFTPGESEKISVGMEPEAQDSATNTAAKPAKDKKEDVITYYKVPIKVIVAGTYHNIANFMSEIANLDKVVSIGDFTISRNSDSSLLGEQLAKQANEQKLLTAELAFDVYYLN